MKIFELEDGLVIGVCGLKGFVDVNYVLQISKNVESQFRVTAQFFDASLIASWEHVVFSAFNAIKAFEAGRNIAKNLGMEVLVRLSGQRQISVALKLMGLKEECKELGIVIIGESRERVEEAIHHAVEKLGLMEDDSTLELNSEKAERIREVFGIGSEELESVPAKNYFEALVKCCVERSALLMLES